MPGSGGQDHRVSMQFLMTHSEMRNSTGVMLPHDLNIVHCICL